MEKKKIFFKQLLIKHEKRFFSDYYFFLSIGRNSKVGSEERGIHKMLKKTICSGLRIINDRMENGIREAEYGYNLR